MLADKIGEHPECREIRPFGSFEKELPIFLIPEKFISVGVKAEGLVQLKIKNNGCHGHVMGGSTGSSEGVNYVIQTT